MNNRNAKKMYRLVQLLRKEPVFEKIRSLEKSQWYSEDEIKNLQFKKLKRILIHAIENIPYYRTRFHSFSEQIYSMKDTSILEKLPILNKRDIQENYSDMQWQGYRGRTAVENTSGSTGDPFKFVLDRNSSAYIRALSYREHQWHGIGVGAKEARFYGMPMDFMPNLKERFKDFLMNRKRFTVFDLSKETLLKYYQTINRYKPEYIYGYASSVVEFIKFLKSNNYKFKGNFLKAIITTSEVLYDEDRKMLEAYLKIPVINEYGTSELGILAAECPEGEMHLSSENSVVEIVKDGKTLPIGERGEVVLTGLNNMVMPLIKYRVGDVASISANRCKCGRGLPILNNIDGRVNNMVVTPEGQIASGLVFYYISRSLIENNRGIKKFKVTQDEIDQVTFHIVKGDNFSKESLDVLVEKTHEYLSPKINVEFEFYDELAEKTSGKIIHFISNVKSPY